MDIKSVPADVDLGGATLIGGVLADLEPAPGSEDLLGSVDTALVEAAGFDGKTGQVLRAPHTTAQSLLLIGLGASLGWTAGRIFDAGVQKTGDGPIRLPNGRRT